MLNDLDCFDRLAVVPSELFIVVTKFRHLVKAAWLNSGDTDSV
jgi:hypothetical protein